MKMNLKMKDLTDKEKKSAKRVKEDKFYTVESNILYFNWKNYTITDFDWIYHNYDKDWKYLWSFYN